MSVGVGGQGAGGAMLDPGVLDDVVRRIVAVARPERIILFGSAARAAWRTAAHGRRRSGKSTRRCASGSRPPGRAEIRRRNRRADA